MVRIDETLSVFVASVATWLFHAPGTAGSLAAPRVRSFVGVPYPLRALHHRAGCESAWASSGTEAPGRKDPGVVVIDEVLGMLITLALLPLSIAGIVLGFLLFRLFDVVKPYPAAQLEHLHGGLGIMADDAVAGLYSYLALRLCVWMMPAWLTA